MENYREMNLGGRMSNRPLHFIWIADCSGSMSIDGKIQQLNYAIRSVIPDMRRAAADNPNAQVLVRAVKFSTHASWHVKTPTPIEEFTWEDLGTEGMTDMGEALELVAEQLTMPLMSERALPPVLVLITDGQPSDDFNAGLAKLMSEPWGKRAIRIAIGIGNDADFDVLQKFIGDTGLKPLNASNKETLVRHIQWASTIIGKDVGPQVKFVKSEQPAAVKKPGEIGIAPAGKIYIPTPPPTPTKSNDDLEWGD